MKTLIYSQGYGRALCEFREGKDAVASIGAMARIFGETLVIHPTPPGTVRADLPRNCSMLDTEDGSTTRLIAKP